MAISDSTANTMSDWYTKSLQGASTSTTPEATPNTGSVLGGTAPAATAPAATSAPSTTSFNTAAQGGITPTASSGASASTPAVDLNQWYTDITGRKADAQGAAYWNNRLANLGSGENVDSIYKEFINSAKANSDYAPGSYSSGPSQIDLDSLKNREVDSGQTVAGQLGGLLDANSNYIQSARDRAQRAANARGLSNSSIAASAGEDSAYQAALPIATSDAQVNRDVSAYNAALYNQGLMYNTDAQNTFQNNAIAASNATKAQQAQIEADKATQAANLGSQMSLAQLQAATSKYQADKSEATSKYNTDAATKQQAEQNKTTLVNNIIQTTDLSPDRKAELLKQLGEPGLASAIYVATDIASDLKGGGLSEALSQAAGVISGK